MKELNRSNLSLRTYLLLKGFLCVYSRRKTLQGNFYTVVSVCFWLLECLVLVTTATVTGGIESIARSPPSRDTTNTQRVLDLRHEARTGSTDTGKEMIVPCVLDCSYPLQRP
jgi:hypothetical protein